MPATMKDIARETGLGLATISKYLNGGNVRPQNRVAIAAAIDKLDYRVNQMARGLKSNKSGIIGVVIPELNNLFITSIITVVEERLRLQGYSVIICDCHTDEALECEVVQFLLDKQVDGIINMPVCPDGRHLAPAVARGIPILLLDRLTPPPGGKVDAVLVDNAAAAKTATSHLLERGHTRIGIVVGPPGIYTSGQRLQGYTAALQEAGLEVDMGHVVHSDYTMQGGASSIRRLLAAKPDITAAFVTNYDMTLGAIIALNELGVSVPDRLSLIGFDNMQLSKIVHPHLTVISQPLEEIGIQAAAIMLRGLNDETPAEPIVLTLGTTLLPGASVKTL